MWYQTGTGHRITQLRKASISEKYYLLGTSNAKKAERLISLDKPWQLDVMFLKWKKAMMRRNEWPVRYSPSVTLLK